MGAFLATAAVGFAIEPSQSVVFWTKEFFATDRAGAPDYTLNQALTGLLARTGMGGEMAGKVMLPGLLLVALLAIWAAYHLLRANRPVTTLLMLLLAVSLSAPIAVTHHWAGVVVAVPLALRTRHVLTFLASMLLIVANLVAPYGVYPKDLPHYSFDAYEWFVGNLQGLAGLVAFVLLLVAAWRCRRVGDASRA